MNGNAEHANASVAKGFFATVWPHVSPADSEFQRRKKVVIRNAQLGVAAMVAAGVIGAFVADFRLWSPLRVGVLLVAAVTYTAWSWMGLRVPIRALLDEGTSTTSPPVTPQRVLYFVVQLGLATLVFTLSNQVRGGALAWLVLLPPVAHSVILLPRLGIATVAVTSIAVLAVNVVARQGWSFVVSATIAFLFAVVFTLIFTMLTVSAERSRGQVQKLADELAAANRKLREYAVEAEELAATRERNRLAREIHDSLGHYLTVVNVQIEAARAVQSSDAAKSRDALDKAQSLTQEGLKEIRRSVAALRASPLENKSLAGAIRQIADDTRASGVSVDMQIVGAERELSAAVELTLYRAAQEGLTNVRKHAANSRATLRLDFSDAARVRLVVSNDGAGATSDWEHKRGFGLLGLRERAHLLGGTVKTQTAPGAGFALEVEVPG